MGFSLFGSSGNKSTSSTTTNVNQTVTAGAQQGDNSLALQNSAGATINFLDGGALDTAERIASRAIDSGNDALNGALSFGGDALSSNADAIKRALAFGSDALSSSQEVNQAALEEVARINSDSLSMFSELVKGALDNSKTQARDAMQGNQLVLSGALNGFKELAIQNTQSSDDRLQKVVQYAVVAFALVMIVPKLFAGGKGAAFA